ncbi:MAG: phosphatase PAP2 family protein [Aldersonia sp.]|nr:phosphatase PAP2 family protein [Aldersonia sp.]
MDTLTRARRPVAALAVSTGVLATAFVLLAVAAAHSQRLMEFDEQVTDVVVSHRTAALTAVFRVVTFFGGVAQATVITIVAAAVIWKRQRSPLPALVFAGAVGLAGTISSLTKLTVGRPRPPADIRMTGLTNYAYPSGHVTATTSVVATLLVLTAGAAVGVRLWLGLLATLIVAAMAASRVYLGAHWLSDTVGGALLGTTAAGLAAVVLRVWAEPG